LADLESGASQDLATRAVKIQEALKDENLEVEKRIELERELALALANTSPEEVEQAKIIAEENETERILRQLEEKRTAFEQEIADFQDKIAQEESLQADLIEKQKAMEASYTAFFE
jgi:hypothetical protein